MNYAAIKYRDIANGTGVRTVLFVSGCTHHCKGCFQPQTWDFCYGEPFTEDVMADIAKSLNPDYVEGLTILGGEPMEPENQKEIVHLIMLIRFIYGGSKNIWIYSGYTFEEITKGKAHCEATEAILRLTDVLVDGEFVEEEKDITLRFRGSRNQRLIDLKKSLDAGEAVLWEG